LHVPLTLEERNLLSVAYKNQIGARRASWRIVTSIEAKQVSINRQDRVDNLKAYRTKIEEELNATCEDILKILTDDIIPFVAEEKEEKFECLVFYYKMKADYYRYLAEFSTGASHDKATADAKASYDEASEIAKENLATTHPIRLGLALNNSVFYFEIMTDPSMACSIAQDAFDQAIKDLDNVSEESYRDSTLIMQLLRDNLSLWKESANETDKNAED
ncbi:14-3-3 protein, partial [Dissophora ornata]